MKLIRFTRYDGEEIAVNRDSVCNISPAGEGESYITYMGQQAQSRVKGKFTEVVAALDAEPADLTPEKEAALKEEAPKIVTESGWEQEK